MFCTKCGNPCNDGDTVCTRCGAPLGGGMPVQMTLRQKLVAAFRQPLFLTGCILATVSAVPLFSDFDVIRVLYVIFLWILYANAQKGKCEVKHLRNVSGTVFAQYVINWVIVGCCALGAVLSLALGNTVVQILSGLEDLGLIGGVGSLMAGISGVALGILLLICFLVMIVAVVLLNLLVYKPLHQFAKSLYENVEQGKAEPEDAPKAATRILVLGILLAMGALASIAKFGSFIAGGCSAAFLIVMYVWFKNNFIAQ